MLEGLNEEQLKAAKTLDGPVMILAGAGSGKTTVIVKRTGNIIRTGKAKGSEILVMTFTNKAAKEMNERAKDLLSKFGLDNEKPVMTTFHSFCLKFIKNYISHTNEIKENFSIADSSLMETTLKGLLKSVYSESEIGKDGISETKLLAVFGILKNNLISHKEEEKTFFEIKDLIHELSVRKKSTGFLSNANISPTNDNDIKKLADIFVLYKKTLRDSNMLDFDDLIDTTINILKENKEIRTFTKDKYKYIMVDEFQDTNLAQISLLDLLINKNKNICVVGDDNQSIYGWRGADIHNILSFNKKFEKCDVINLKTNYRSAHDIVSKSNKLIESAEERHELKQALVSFKKESGNIEVNKFYNTDEEASYVSDKIKMLLRNGISPNEITILYRSNMVVSFFEKALIKNKIPYQIFKGRTILERKSSIELMSLLTMIFNEKNYICFKELLTSTLNVISESQMEKVIVLMNEKGVFINNLKDFIFENRDHKILVKNKEKIERLYGYIDILKEYKNMEDAVLFMADNCPIIEEYSRISSTTKNEKTKENALSNLSNMYELLELLKSYESINHFYEEITLSSEVSEDDKNKINLMTCHASKGLEFEHVFIVKMNEGIFPSAKSISFNDRNEERRLAYVAMTRAKTGLYISYATKFFNKELPVSQFIKEADLKITDRTRNSKYY